MKERSTKKLVALSRAALALCVALVPGVTTPVQASSHREAPFITEQPKVDGTDFYMFRSYEVGRSSYTTLIANYVPLQDAYGGPNYFTMDPDALYEIHIDNNGDAKEDLTFQFRFKVNPSNTKLNINGKQVAVPLRNIGTISAASDANQTDSETYSIKVVRGNRRTGTVSDVVNHATGSRTFKKPYDYVGDKTFTNAAGYTAYASQFIQRIDIPGCSDDGKVFVGQRADPFSVNLGEVFDLVNTNPLGARNAELNLLADKNVTSIALEIPTSCLTQSATQPIIGGWTTASLRQARLLNPTPSRELPAKEGGAWTQVSRLGMPLVNEIVIGLPDKDKFNASKPTGDGQFLDYVTNPTLPTILNVLFGVTAPAVSRTDLVAIFLTGVSGVNQPPNVVGSEMLRLNTAIAATARGGQNNLGAAVCFPNRSLVPDLTNVGCDPAGFPNGRRLGDDVVDIELRAAMGFFLSNADAPSGALAYTDGAIVNDTDFGTAFPYENIPNKGSPSN